MSTPDLLHLKHRIHNLWTQLNTADLAESQRLLEAAVTPDTQWNISHPVNDLHGADALLTSYWTPLKAAMPNIRRTHYILMASEHDSSPWVSATGYYRGTFIDNWLGFPVAGRPVSLRFGEFLRMEGDRIAEVYMILDIVDVLRQVGVEVFPRETGETGFVPGPQKEDGVILYETDADIATASKTLVFDMIDGLMQYDGVTLSSMDMKRFWEPDMLWYGPAGIGTTRGLDGFEDHHQRPFLTAFP
ncbi:MAG: ester cyclase, partial [Chloroflexota bacterium]